MHTIGIDDNLNRARIRKLLLIGLAASVITGIGDSLLGYAAETESISLAASVMSGARNLSDTQMIAGSLLVYLLLALFWIPMLVVQFKAFAEGLTPYPPKAEVVNLIVGALPALIAATIIGPHRAIGAFIGTMFLSFGNAFSFGGLLATPPDQATFMML